MDLPVNSYVVCCVGKCKDSSQIQAEGSEETFLTLVFDDHAVLTLFLFIITLYRFRLIFSGSFAPPTLQGMGIMARCHAESASTEKNAGCLGHIGDILHSHMGIMINHYLDPY